MACKCLYDKTKEGFKPFLFILNVAKVRGPDIFCPYIFVVKSYLQAVGHTTGHSNLVFLNLAPLDLETGDTMFKIVENAKYGSISRTSLHRTYTG